MQHDGWSWIERENNPLDVRLRVKCCFKLAKVDGKCLVRTTVMAADLQVPTRPEGAHSQGWHWASQQLHPHFFRLMFRRGQFAAPLLPRRCSPTLSRSALGVGGRSCHTPTSCIRQALSWSRVRDFVSVLWPLHTERWGRGFWGLRRIW